MMPQLRTVIIGAGLIGKKRSLHLPDSFDLIGIFDVNLAAAQLLISQLDRQPKVVSSLEELFQLSPEVVIIATTHQTLPIFAISALNHGCHVFLEKPGANELLPLENIRDLAKSKDRIVHVGYNHRFHPSFLKASELIASEKYGKLLWIRARYGHGGRIGYENEWRANRAISGGGELLDQGSHLIDLTRMLIGDVELAYSRLQTSFWRMEVEDNAFIALDAKVGGFVWLHASWTEWKNTFSFEITLESAKIDIHGLGGSYGNEQLTLYEMQPEMGPPPFKAWQWDESDTSWRAELNDFHQAIIGEPFIGATIDDAIAVHEIVGEAYKK
jgi:predicted dehydrogenase